MSSLRQVALESKAWPFQQARKLVKKFEKDPPEKGHVLFETGYGPSGLPHLGTFGEVARTLMVRHAFQCISDFPTKLICFSDDLDGLRKVPKNVPNRHFLQEDLNLPLTRVRDPFGTHESFAHHNNARLQDFLDRFGFDYEFASSTEYYRSGRFDEALLLALERFDDLMAIMLPTLGAVVEGRRESYSPFLPISPKTGHVLQVPTLERNLRKGTIVYEEPDGERIEIPVTGGNVKMQWKPDWAMRWAALEVDYEMYGKDLIPSAEIGCKICRLLGKPPPVGLNFELFLDEQGRKISKSSGTSGISMEEWLDYATPESLSLFMYQKPQTAKRLFFDIIPKTVDEYHQQLRAYPKQGRATQLNNPVWHIHQGNPPTSSMSFSYSMLLNLVSVSSSANTDVLWRFIQRYEPGVSPETHPDLASAAECAVRYYRDRIAPDRKLRHPTKKEAEALHYLCTRLKEWNGPAEGEELQKLVYAVGKERGFDPLRDWFRCIYEVVFGASQGPRFGGFIALYGIQDTIALIERRLMCS